MTGIDFRIHQAQLKKLVLDPEADGKQWKYKGYFVQWNGGHPSLNKYAIYNADWSCIGSSDTLKGCRQFIDNETSSQHGAG